VGLQALSSQGNESGLRKAIAPVVDGLCHGYQVPWQYFHGDDGVGRCFQLPLAVRLAADLADGYPPMPTA
jgi:hypothetical protein